MSAFRFALIGSGWRAAFYARLARKMPERFRLVSTWVHSPEKAAAWQGQYGGQAISGEEAWWTGQPEFLVVALNKQYSLPYVLALLDTDMPLLLETPPAVQPEDLAAVWRKAEGRRAPVYVAEQYPDHPFFSAWRQAVAQGLLGPVSNISISAAHGYHAVALMRAFLGIGGENGVMEGRRYAFPVERTGDRDGLIVHGGVRQAVRQRATVLFDGGKTAFYDFAVEQYHSAIRFNHFSVQGERGEIADARIRYLNEWGQPVEMPLVRRQLGQQGCGEAVLQGITLGERWVYENPCPGVPLSDDEMALAVCLERMGQAARGKAAQGYPLAQALQDAHLAWHMAKAVETGQAIRTTDGPWRQALG